MRSNTEPYIDLHCHFLPEMDDGCKSVEESVKLLEEQWRQGCVGIASTSHYYARESIAEFLARREASFAKLRAALEKVHPEYVDKIVFGAEAAYHPALLRDPDLPKLCIGKSRYLLLEMPFEPWSPRILRDVQSLLSTTRIRPVIAHLERYLDLVDEDAVDALVDMDVLIQMNAGCIQHFSSKRKAVRLLRDGIIDVIGTDSHNLTSRAPNMAKGIQKIRKAGFDGEMDDILAMNEEIFQAALGAPEAEH